MLASMNVSSLAVICMTTSPKKLNETRGLAWRKAESG